MQRGKPPTALLRLAIRPSEPVPSGTHLLNIKLANSSYKG